MKDIPGFEGIYVINEDGEVYALPRITVQKHRLPFRKIAQVLNTEGYPCVNLKKDGKQHMRRVHRLLGMVFIHNPENKPFINHKNGIKTDNRLCNLEWCTRSENAKHSYDVLKRCLPDGPRNARSKLILDTYTGVYYDSIKFAAMAKCTTRGVLKWHLRTNGGWNGLIYA